MFLAPNYETIIVDLYKVLINQKKGKSNCLFQIIFLFFFLAIRRNQRLGNEESLFRFYPAAALDLHRW